jgi:hypothetical protein
MRFNDAEAVFQEALSHAQEQSQYVSLDAAEYRLMRILLGRVEFHRTGKLRRAWGSIKGEALAAQCTIGGVYQYSSICF